MSHDELARVELRCQAPQCPARLPSQKLLKLSEKGREAVVGSQLIIGRDRCFTLNLDGA